MKRLIYISTAIDTIQESDIDDIVATAQRVNEVQSLTGVLLFNGLNFLQLLEGPQSNVENINNRILTDKRRGDNEKCIRQMLTTIEQLLSV